MPVSGPRASRDRRSHAGRDDHGGKSRVKTLGIDGRPEELESLIAARVAVLQ